MTMEGLMANRLRQLSTKNDNHHEISYSNDAIFIPNLKRYLGTSDNKNDVCQIYRSVIKCNWMKN
jgi:hypothetical protein